MAYILLVAHVLGFFSSLQALMTARTPQGTIAWIVSLNTIPIVAVPAYWIFGRDRFQGYIVDRRKLSDSKNSPIVSELVAKASAYRSSIMRNTIGERLADLPYLDGNRAELLVDGAATFDSIFSGIERAEHSVLVQFYIVRDDELGRALQERLIERAKSGVSVYFLYDEIGSAGLPESYVARLKDAGVLASAFHATRGSGNRFQLNFRNHRKIVVVDRQTGWVGGHNVGDEYLGKDPEVGHWRDTHLRLTGPSILGLMISFAEDWNWATGESLPQSLWNVVPVPAGEATALILPTGPADRLETASLMYQQAIQAATNRIWIASPYFVPDQAVMHALHLAALRGVDVRVVIPDKPDSRLVYYSAFNFAESLLRSGARIYRYVDGFLHQKVFLIDDVIAGIGTANFDNRSFRLNFEVTAVVRDRDLAQAVERMLRNDFENAKEMTDFALTSESFFFRVAVRASFLLAPLQ